MNRILKLLTWYSTLLASQLPGQTYSVIHNFTNNPDGQNPMAGLVLGGNTLYGTTFRGGSAGTGIVFKLDESGGGYTVLHSFSALARNSTNADGGNPQGNLTLVGDTLYGTARNGGPASTTTTNGGGGGTVFMVDTNGTNFSVLQTFNFRQSNPPGSQFPEAGLVPGSNILYGTSFGSDGGGYGPDSFGFVFAINLDGTGFTNLAMTVGANPLAGLVLANGILYGTDSSEGGSTNLGSVFAVSIGGGGLTNLIKFSTQSNTNGGLPAADLVLSGETLYGTCSSLGGVGGLGGGTVFKISTEGTGFKVLKNFVNNTHALDGTAPVAGLLLSGSTLYGTTKWGGSSGDGTVFSVGTDGTGFTVLKNFQGSDGANPVADLVSDGTAIYGTTATGGSAGDGVVFSLTLPPPPLLITNSSGAPVVFWVDDGRNHTLQTTTNLNGGSWSNGPPLNWTNSSGGEIKFGCKIPNSSDNPAAFFLLQ